MEVRTARINSRGAFDMSLTFTWDPIPARVLDSLNNDRTAGIESPAMAGGLFAIDREYFYKLGSYDEKMKIWYISVAHFIVAIKILLFFLNAFE